MSKRSCLRRAAASDRGEAPRHRFACCGSRRCARSPPTPKRRCANRSSTSGFRGRSSREPATPPPRCARDRRAACRRRSSRRRNRCRSCSSRDDAREMFADLRAVVVDEWHELMGTEARRSRRVGAGASPLLPAARSHLGPLGDHRQSCRRARRLARRRRRSERGRIVRGVEPKQVVIDALIPPVVERFPWAGHLGTQMLPQVVEAIEEGDSAIVFTNTRSQTEIWYQAILAARPDWAGVIALHHGSLDRARRDWVENGLRAGRLRCVVATSSLDLGVDFSPVDRVLQIGSPKGVARLLQRAGRSGHRPGAVEPRDVRADERARADRGCGGARRSRSGARSSRACLSIVRSTCSRNTSSPSRSAADSRRNSCCARCERRARMPSCSDDEWAGCSSFSRTVATRCARIPSIRASSLVDGRYVVENDEIARRHRMSIGTIVGDAQIGVSLHARLSAWVRGGIVHRAAQARRPIRVRRNAARVRARARHEGVGAARAERKGRDSALGGKSTAAVRPARGDCCARDSARRRAGVYRGAEMEAVRPLLEVQRKWSRIPARGRAADRAGEDARGLASVRLSVRGPARARRIGRAARVSVVANRADHVLDGVERLRVRAVCRRSSRRSQRGARRTVCSSPDDLLDDITAALNATEMAKRQFRELARVAGLVFPGFPRSGKTARQLQVSSGLFFDVLAAIRPGQPAARRRPRAKCWSDSSRARGSATRCDRIARSTVVVTEPRRPTPLAFPLVVDRNRERVSSESLGDRMRRMQLALERAAG